MANKILKNCILIMFISYPFVGILGGSAFAKFGDNGYLTPIHIYGILLCFALMLINIKNGKINQVLFPLFLKFFLLYIIFHSFILIFFGYGIDIFKLLQFLFFNIITLYLAFLLLPIKLTLEDFFLLVKRLSVIWGIVLIVVFLISNYRASLTASSHTNTVILSVGLCFLVLQRNANNFYNFCTAILLLGAIILSSSRISSTVGVMLFLYFLASIFMEFLLKLIRLKLIIKNLIIFSMLFILIFLMYINMSQITTFYFWTRLTLYMDYFLKGLKHDTSILAREEYINYTLTSLGNMEPLKLLFGYGMGNFKNFYNYPDYTYPHNIFIEVLIEFGIIGFLIIIGLIGESIYKILHLSVSKNEKKILLVSFIIFILYSMVYGDITAHRYLFFWILFVYNIKVVMREFIKEVKKS